MTEEMKDKMKGPDSEMGCQKVLGFLPGMIKYLRSV